MSCRVTGHPERIPQAGLVLSGPEPHSLLPTTQAFELTRIKRRSLLA